MEQECIPPPPVQPEPQPAAANTEFIEVITRLQRQVEKHQWVIAQLIAGNNHPTERANVEAQPYLEEG